MPAKHTHAQIPLQETKSNRKWLDTRSARLSLGESGWLSPDTYDKWFAPVEDITPAVYLFLLHETTEWMRCTVAYVGMSRDVERRWSNHEILRDLYAMRGYWPMRWFLPTEPDKLRDEERRYISMYDPSWNIAGRRRGEIL